MVFKKPYAFFIKIFKPLHIFLALILTYLLYIQNGILRYFNSYIHSINNGIKVNVNNFIYIIPIIFIILFVLILGVMYKKNKPFKFYIFASLSFIVILIIDIYSANFLNQLIDNTLPVRIVKLAHDLILLNIIIESIIFALLIIRGLGINIKKFDFSSDLLKLDISESDREEFEVSINVDIDMKKRKRKSRIRNLKYKYLEKKALYNTIFIFVIALLIVIFSLIGKDTGIKKQNYEYLSNDFSFKINNVYTISKNINIDDFSLNLENVEFKPTTKYTASLIDVGNTYNNTDLSNSYVNYLIVFEVPIKYLDSKAILDYLSLKGHTKIKVNPITYNVETKNIVYRLGEEASLKDSLGDIKFTITEFDIQDKYLINYDYCRNDNCLSSIEYLKPTINQNFDKTIMRLKVNYSNNSNINLTSFYELLSRFGILIYDGKIQSKNFENIKSTKKNTGYIYIGVNKDIMNSENIKLMFNIRNVNIEYVFRGES